MAGIHVSGGDYSGFSLNLVKLTSPDGRFIDIPQNVIYEDIKNTYDYKILEAEEAFRNNLINIDEKNNIVFNL